MISNLNDYYQIHRMTDDIPNSFPLISNQKDALKYLYFLDQTSANSSAVYNIIDYELLIYLELFFQNDEEIQQLIKNIKENIFHDFVVKHKYIKRLTDDLCENNLPNFMYDFTTFHFTDLGIKKEDLNEKI